MESTEALDRTDKIVTALIGGLTPDDRERPTPCDDWTVHDLIDHMCGGAHWIAGTMLGEEAPEQTPDFLADGPANGWQQASAHLRAAATPEVLGGTYSFPFGEMPGANALAVIVADALAHAWDLAKATDQDPGIDDELADWGLAVWQPIVPAEGRSGPGFKDPVAVGADASGVDRFVAYLGRKP